MRLRRLLLLLGLGAIGAMVLRSRADRPATEIAIDDRDDDRLPHGAESASRELRSVDGIGPAYAERLEAAGVEDTAALADADVEALAEETGIAPARLRSWQEQLATR